MNDIQQLIINIKEKTEKLVERNRSLSLENREINEKLMHIQRSIELQRETIKDLEEKNKLLKIANSMASDDEGKKALKQKINSVIREIDKSMLLLND